MIEIKPQKASELANTLNGKLYGKDCNIDKVTIDTREDISENACFFAIHGKRVDGHDYCKVAREKGVRLLVVDKRADVDSSYILVQDTKIALGALAKNNINKTKIVAVTGSVGKTTVKNMIISVLQQKYKVCGTVGNENNEIGVPLTLLNIKDEDFCVVEMGMRGSGEIDYLASIAQPETVVITNAMTSHIERLKTKENIFLAKCEILNYNPKNAILPSEKRFFDLKNDCKVKKIFVGKDGNLLLENVNYNNESIFFNVKFNENYSKKMKIYSINIHDAQNAVFAYAVGKIYNLSDNEIAKGLLEYKHEKMRSELQEVNGILIINDCYNASYESVKSSLEALVNLSKIKNKNPCALLGDMLELGDEAKLYHEKIGAICTALNLKKVFYIGAHSQEIKKHFKSAVIVDNISDAGKILLSKIDKNDMLLVKASRKMNFEKIIADIKRENG